MSGDLYRIAVSIALTSNHAGVLGAMAAQLTGIHGQLGKLHEEWDRVKLAMAGGIAIGGGTLLLEGLKAVNQQAAELSKNLAQLKTQGLNDVQVKMADEVAKATTTMVPGSTESGNVKLISEAYSLMGLENAKKALPKLAEAVQVFGAIDGNYKKAEETIYSIIKSTDMLGKLQDEHTGLIDPEKLGGFLDVMAKVSAATGNKVNASTLFGMVQQGAPALANMSDDGLMSMLMAAQTMGGHRAGTALTALYQQAIGGSMTEAKAKELHRLGLVGGYDVGRGGHLTFHRGALETPFARALEKNPLEGMHILQEAMKSHGYETVESQTKELFSLLGRQTTQRLVSDFIRNLPNMGAEQGRMKGGQGLDAQAQTRNSEDLLVAEHNFHEAYKNLMEAIGGPQNKAAIEVLNRLTAGINSFTEVVRATNPDTIVAIAKGIGILGVGLTGAGAVALLAAIGPAGWIAGGIVALTAAAAAWKPDLFNSAWQQIKTFFHEIGTLFDGSVWKKTWSDATKDIANFFNEAIKLIPANVRDTITAAFTTIGEYIKEGFKKLFQIGDGPGRLPGQTPAPGAQSPNAPGKGGDWQSAIAPMSYEGSGFRSLVHTIAFGSGGQDSPMADAVYSGVLRAFRELMGMGGGSGGGSGFQNASFVTGGGANDNYGGASGVARALGRGGFGAGGSIPGVPSSVQMSEDERNTLGLIQKYESGGRNTMNYIGDRTHTAQGYYQITNSNWRHIAPMLGITAPSAMAASLEDQTRVAQYLLHHSGVGNWSRYNSALRGALARGEHAPIGVHTPAPTASAPPRQPREEVHIHNVYLDSDKIERYVTRRQVAKMRFPTSVGGTDSYGNWHGPATAGTKVA